MQSKFIEPTKISMSSSPITLLSSWLEKPRLALALQRSAAFRQQRSVLKMAAIKYEKQINQDFKIYSDGFEVSWSCHLFWKAECLMFKPDKVGPWWWSSCLRVCCTTWKLWVQSKLPQTRFHEKLLQFRSTIRDSKKSYNISIGPLRRKFTKAQSRLFL